MTEAKSGDAERGKQREQRTETVRVGMVKAGSQVIPLSAANEIALPDPTLATHLLMGGMRSVEFPAGLEITCQLLVSQDGTEHLDRHLIFVENGVIELAIRHLS